MPSIIQIPLAFDELEAKPKIPAQIRLSDDMQQALSLLCGFNGSQRSLLRCSPSGILYFTSAKVKGIINITADGDGDTWQGSNISTSEVLIKAYHPNQGHIWWNFNTAAAVKTGYQLNTGDTIAFGLSNLVNLYLYFVKDADHAMIIYTE